MVRAFVGSALLLCTLGFAAAFLGPSLSAAPGGEAMLVRGAAISGLHQARFDASDCVPALLVDEAEIGTKSGNLTVLELTFRRVPEGLAPRAVFVGKGDRVSAETLIVVLDPSGQVLAATPAAGSAVANTSAVCPLSDEERSGLI